MIEQVAFWVAKARKANHQAVSFMRRGWGADAESGCANRDTYMHAARVAKARHQETLLPPF